MSDAAARQGVLEARWRELKLPRVLRESRFCGFERGAPNTAEEARDLRLFQDGPFRLSYDN